MAKLSAALAPQTRVDPCLWGCGRAFHLIHRSVFYITALSIIPPGCFRRSASNCSVHRAHTIPLATALLLDYGSLITPSNPADVHHAEPPGSVGRCPCVQLHINTHCPPCFFPDAHHLHCFNCYAHDLKSKYLHLFTHILEPANFNNLPILRHVERQQLTTSPLAWCYGSTACFGHLSDVP
jgi:hypothetical protein